jgi:hypothetical protein
MVNNKLNDLSPEALVELLLQYTSELLDTIVKPDNEEEIHAKIKQAELLHSRLVHMLIEKKAAEHPGMALSY